MKMNTKMVMDVHGIWLWDRDSSIPKNKYFFTIAIPVPLWILQYYGMSVRTDQQQHAIDNYREIIRE